MRETDEAVKIISKWDPSAKVILFGSRARGEHLRISDYDLIVVSDRFRGMRFSERATLITKLLYRNELILPLDLLCYTEEEFERKRRELGTVRTAVSEGIEL